MKVSDAALVIVYSRVLLQAVCLLNISVLQNHRVAQVVEPEDAQLGPDGAVGVVHGALLVVEPLADIELRGRSGVVGNGSALLLFV